MRQDWLIGQLPAGMLDDDFLLRFLGIFQSVADTVMHQVDTIDHLADTAVAPPDVVRYMGGWLGETMIDPALPATSQRRIVSQAGRSLPWRGTAAGLGDLLEATTGFPVTIVDPGGVHREDEAPVAIGPVVVDIARRGQATAEQLAEIVRSEMPASATYELRIEGIRVWPSPSPDELALLQPKIDLNAVEGD